MNRKLYYVILGFSALLLITGIIIIFTSDWDIPGSLISGAAASLIASAIIQIFASEEQIRLLQELNLSIEGIQPLPREFRRLKWFAHTTIIPTERGKQTEWRCERLEKRNDSGNKCAIYYLPARNPVGEIVRYSVAFVGLKECVTAIISHGDERTSVFTYDVPVSTAGYYFGPGYITDWYGKRDLAVSIVSIGDMPDISREWPLKLKNALMEWHNSVEWDVEPLFAPFIDTNKLKRK